MTREQFIRHVESGQKEFRRFLTALCCGNTAMADDVAQEAYIKAYLSSDGLEATEKFRPWLYRIGYTTFLNHRRGERITAPIEEARQETSEQGTDSTFRYQALHLALEKIPSRERSVLLLFYMEGYAVKEIATIMDASEDAVKQYLSRGRNHLRGLLSPQ